MRDTNGPLQALVLPLRRSTSGSGGHEFPDGDSRFGVNIYQQHIASSRNPLVSVPTSERREQVCSFFFVYFFVCC